MDIIAHDRDASSLIGVRVNTLRKHSPAPLGTSFDKIMGNFWLIVNKAATPNPSAFVLLQSKVCERAQRDERAVGILLAAVRLTMSRTHSEMLGNASVAVAPEKGHTLAATCGLLVSRRRSLAPLLHVLTQEFLRGRGKRFDEVH